MGLFTWDRYELLTIVLMYNMAVKSSRCYAFLLSYCDLEDIEDIEKKRGSRFCRYILVISFSFSLGYRVL